jgi:hypothetical protein
MDCGLKSVTARSVSRDGAGAMRRKSVDIGHASLAQTGIFVIKLIGYWASSCHVSDANVA